MSYRRGRFTSSAVHVFIKAGRGKDAIFSAPAKTIIEEKKLEILTNRSFDADAYSKAIAHGNLMEKICYELMPFGYELQSMDAPRFHALLPWAGTVDLLTKDTVGEIKCYQLKKFAQYTLTLMKQDLSELKEKFAQEYWQIVSNSILYDTKFGEAISFMPYKHELLEIINDIRDGSMLERFELKPWDYRYITEDSLENLPWIEEGGHFENLTRFRFEVPIADKLFLMERIELASQELSNF